MEHETFKALSIRQPWAELNLRGDKTVESRSQITKIRGRVYIYAALGKPELDRKFVMVQLPEPCHEKTEASRQGYNTISELGRERIRRVIGKLKQETTGNGNGQPNLTELPDGVSCLRK